MCVCLLLVYPFVHHSVQHKLKTHIQRGTHIQSQTHIHSGTHIQSRTHIHSGTHIQTGADKVQFFAGAIWTKLYLLNCRMDFQTSKG